MKYLISLLALSLPLFSSGQVSIIESSGWLESVSAKWSPVVGVDSFSVYLNGNGLINKRVDDQLIRNYGDYYRVDVPGLKAGSYTLTIKPIINELEEAGSTTNSNTVLAHDRTGFAFSNGRTPGAYKLDGTPKDNALIIYITENTKNTISVDVVGANTNPCVGLQAILDGFKKGKDSRPLIVRLVGQITDLDYMLNGDIVIENANWASSSITFEGVGDDAVADGWGIRVKNATNIEIRNIGLMNCDSDEGDNIGLQQNNDYIWVHNCDFFYGNAGSDADQAKGDGALDTKKSTYVTISYNHFWDSGKSNLLGLGEGTTEGLYITYHHNWYDHSDSRHPRVRFYSAHVYNNYYDGNSKYGIGSTLGSSVFSEANYFRNCKYPMLTSMQGSDVFNESTQSNDYTDWPTFSKEDGGTIKAFNNFMIGEKRFVNYGNPAFPNPTVDFDAYVADTRNELVSSSVVSAFGANTYNNFDTNPAVMYSYVPDSPADAIVKVQNYAGRMFGGDFVWMFNNAVDDFSDAVITGLKTELTNYSTSLVAVQGDGAPPNGGDPGGGDPGTGEGLIHNFTVSGLTSDFYNISGNLSDSKGTVLYDGLTLTQCLKIESVTLISFTAAEAGTLLLVFNDTFNGGIKINDVSRSVTNGVLSMAIDAGNYQLTKDAVANLYYMAVIYEGTGGGNAPIVKNPVDDYLVEAGFSEMTIDLSNVFEDADSDPLSISAVSDAPSISVQVTNNLLTITEAGVGTANITLTADDQKDGTATETFAFHINAAPAVANPLADRLESSGFGSITIDLINTFTDANDDNLLLSASSGNTEVVGVIISGKSLTINEAGSGTATITVTANDGMGQEVSDSFIFVVEEILALAPELAGSVNVYPNPVQNILTIESTINSELVPLIVTNLNGQQQTIEFRKKAGACLLDFTPLQPGVYLVYLQAGSGTSVIKVIRR